MKAIVSILGMVFIAAPSFAVTLALNWKAEPQFGGFYQAQEKGEFKARGLEVEIVQGGAGTPTVQMLAAGKVEYAIVSADELVIANGRGAHLVPLFAAFQKNPQALMAHAERRFKNIDDLFTHPGTLAWQEGLPYAVYLKQKFKNPKVTFVPYLGGISNFITDANDSQQCFASSEPLIAEARKVKTTVFLIADAGFNPYTTVLATRRVYLEFHSDEVRKIVAAVRSGWESYLKHASVANDRMLKLNPSLSHDFIQKSASDQTKFIQASPLGQMTVSRWKELAQQLQGLKLLAHPVPVNDLLDMGTCKGADLCSY